ncbi:MAG: hypothetical protein ACI976_000743 [Aureispira sp.]|jgi:hypothetical protein
MDIADRKNNHGIFNLINSLKYTREVFMYIIPRSSRITKQTSLNV